ncbi:SEFIR domain-containing protein [Spirosoma agri]|uniref:TIR domain-containing protein n=1 Tax=Spirosoma agri TaxID=1987381 RepID=A0A6M0IQI2_9BACT|nr:SEFIR domain-containing protein [Spirosoma agri]NEU70569.1 TIR domain-containing protein [Spirosoma agri]
MNKEEIIYLILEELNKKISPVEFGKFFLEAGQGFGIDNFRNFLDELHQEGLVTKLEKPGEYIPIIGRSALDLRYGISIAGTQYLKSQKMEEAKMHKNNSDRITVFVTYSWDNDEHNDKVLSFTNFLRDNGFEAEVDKMLIQNESAKDFNVMMHKGMTDYKKVVVILSSGYKAKAEEFRGGVGNEFSLILKDIQNNPNKYILVSFEGYKDELIPLFFKGREIINLSENNENEKQKLFAKLLDKKLYEFSAVADVLPVVTAKKTNSLFSENSNPIEDIKLQIREDNSSYFAQLIKNIEFQPRLTFKNSSKSPINEYSIEIYYPRGTISFEVNGRVEGEYIVVTLDETTRLFPQQIKSIILNNFTLRNYTIDQVIDKSIIVKIYTDEGISEKSFPIKEFTIKNSFIGEHKIDTKLFLKE